MIFLLVFQFFIPLIPATVTAESGTDEKRAEFDASNHLIDFTVASHENTVEVNWSWGGDEINPNIFTLTNNGGQVSGLENVIVDSNSDLEGVTHFTYRVEPDQVNSINTFNLFYGESLLATETIEVKNDSELETNKVNFADSNLENVIKEKLAITYDSIITEEDLSGLETLDISGKNIKSLAGLEHAVNLKNIYMNNNYITDINPLRGLDLEEIELSSNLITKLTPLTTQKNLKLLNVADNPILDLTIILELPSLSAVYISESNINDLESIHLLDELREKNIIVRTYPSDVNNESVEDDALNPHIKNVETLNVAHDTTTDEEITIPDRQLENILRNHLRLSEDDPITKEGLAKLEWLDIYGDVESLEGIEYALNVYEIFIYESNISDLSVLSELGDLIYLNVEENNVPVSFAGLEGTSINYLNIWRSDVVDVENIFKMTSLSVLQINHSQISTIEGIENLDNLVRLTLRNNGLSSIEPILQLNLEYLDFRYQDINLDHFSEETIDVLKQFVVNGTSVILFDRIYPDFRVTEESIIITMNDSEYYYPEFDVYLNEKYVGTSNGEYIIYELEPENYYDIELRYTDRFLEQEFSVKYEVRTATEPVGEKIDFVDINIEEAIRQEINIDRDLYDGDVEDLTFLYGNYADIQSLEDLKWLPNLMHLELAGNNFTDLSPLSVLKQLETLNLSSNTFDDISVLLELPLLESVRFEWIRFTDLENSLNVINELRNNGVEIQISMYSDSDVDIYKEATRVNIDWSYSDLFDVEIVEIHFDGKVKEVPYNSERYQIENLTPNTAYFVSVLFKDNQGNLVDGYIRTIYTTDLVYAYLFNASESTVELEVYIDESTSFNGLSFVFNGEIINPTNVDDDYYYFTGLTPNTEYEVEIQLIDVETNSIVAETYDWFRTRPEPTGDVVDFNNDNFNDYIKDRVNITHRELYESDLERVWWLNISEDRQPHSLHDLRLFKNLEGLYIGNANIDDWSFLEDLTSLYDLEISNSGLTNEDLMLIENHPSISYLYLYNNEITEIEVLLSLSNLYYVSLGEPGLDTRGDAQVARVLEELKQNGVEVFIERFVDEYAYFDVYNTDINETSFTLIWDNIVPSELPFEIRLNGELLDTTTDTSYTFSDLNPGTYYDVYVEAYDSRSKTLYYGHADVWTYEEGAAVSIDFPDANLEAAIKEYLWIKERPLMVGDLQKVEYLHLTGYEIENLNGLEHAINLRSLFAGWNNITELSPIKDLTNLNDLNLYGNNIQDISALKNLINLNYLDLDSNYISNIDILSELPNVEVLWLSHNPITSIDAIAEYDQLSDLYLHGTNLDYEDESTLAILRNLHNQGTDIDIYYDVFVEERVSLYYLQHDISDSHALIRWETDGNLDLVKNINVYSDYELVAELSNDATEYKLDDLASNSWYEVVVEVVFEEEERRSDFYFTYIRTLRPQEDYEQVTFQFTGSDGQIINRPLEVLIEGIDEKSRNWDIFQYGYINNQGQYRTWNNSSTEINLPVGEYEIIVFGEGRYEDSFFNVTVGKDTNLFELEVEMEEYRVGATKITVEDKNGNPIESLSYVNIFNRAIANDTKNEYGRYERFDEEYKDGVIELDDWIEGQYTVNVRADGYESFSSNSVFLEKDGTFKISLKAGLSVQGTVLNELRNAVINANVYVTSNDHSFWAYTTTGNGGEFIVDGLSNDKDYSIEVYLQGYETQYYSVSRDDLNQNGLTVIEEPIELIQEKFIEGRLLDEYGNGASNVFVYLYEEGQRWSSYGTRTDNNGNFRFSAIRDETYRLTTESFNYPNIEIEDVTVHDSNYTYTLVHQTGSFSGDGTRLSSNIQVVTPGNSVNYRLDYKNNGSGTLDDAYAELVLPEELAVVEESLTLNGRDAVFVNGKIQLGDLDPDETGVIRFQARLDSNVSDLASFTVLSRLVSKDETVTLSATTNVLSVTLNAPEVTASKDLKLYGRAKPGATIEVFDGTTLIGTTTLGQSRWWYMDVELPVREGIESEHSLRARVIDSEGGEAVTHSSKVVNVSYEPTIPSIDNVEIHAGWNDAVTLNPNTGVATFAIVEFTPIDVEVTFGDEVDKVEMHFIGETYDLEKYGNRFVGQFPPGWSSYGEQMFEMSYFIGEREIKLPLMEVIVLIDPSGYVFEGSMDNRLSGVQAIVEEDVDGRWIPWNAEFFGQVNPQITDVDGRYGWDVTQGSWRVIFNKEGYGEYVSRIVVTPPEETELNIPLVRTSNPEVVGVKHKLNTEENYEYIIVEFDRLMNESYMNKGMYVQNESGEVVDGSFIFEGYEGYRQVRGEPGYYEPDTTVSLSQYVIWKPSITLESDVDYTFVIEETLRDYDGKSLNDEVTLLFQSHFEAPLPGDEEPEPGEGEEDPGQEPGEEDPGQEPGEEDPGQEPREEDPGQEPREEDPGQEPREEDPGQEPREEDPGQEPREEDPGQEPREEDPGQEPREEDPGQEPREEDPGQEPREEDPGQEPREEDPGQEPREEDPGQEPREEDPGQEPREEDPGQEPREEDPGQEPREEDPGQEPREEDPGQEPREEDPGQEPREEDPGQEPREEDPGQEPREEDPGQEPREEDPGQEPREEDPGQEPREEDPGQEPREEDPGQEPREEDPGQEPREEDPGQEPREEDPGQEPREEDPGQEPREEDPGQEPREEDPGQEPREEDPGQEPGEEDPGQEPGEEDPGQEPGEEDPGQEPGEEDSVQEPEQQKEVEGTKVSEDKSSKNTEEKLPDTATYNYNILLIGIFLLAVGIVIYATRRRVVIS